MSAKPYCVLKRHVVAEAPRLRVLEMHLGQGEQVPRHFHSAADDIFYCLEGDLHIEAESPPAIFRLFPGQSAEIVSGRPHMVSNKGDGLCRFLLVQRGEVFDFIPVEVS
ncbi:Cupin 2 conserved barrel domain protein [Alkalidesulfovibrio alkalitolerans DSM 16529]|jgi:quercetin dioxygenase-like cupin family protein|uniref:Cupin 2 conserved barrel domain protein n=1 Tax=Alkalidesulfovibrio alkalitolerans DSM 16529 TaxID=1121439 RepID=S7TGL0_9BACT|nr:cupin domain-containing protein [Alkalidesulfovibrio alkalitolerans]EPR35730.1 Cupin 2 conserved barrel domain protein [Alkalidesulfovibrio alkalitolerans DSM 16529]